MEIGKRMQDDQRLLDALPDSLAVLDHEGVIHFVNSAWIRFARENGIENLPIKQAIGENCVHAT